MTPAGSDLWGPREAGALLLAGGALLGLAHAVQGPWLPFSLGWVGLLAWASGQAAWRGGFLSFAGLLFGAGALKLWLGHPWHATTYAFTVGGPPGEQVFFLALLTLLWVGLSKGPLVLPWALGRRWPWAGALAFPLAWVAGEAVVAWGFVLRQDAWLSPLWAAPWALRSVALVGWTGSSLWAAAAAGWVGWGLAAGRRAWVQGGVALALGWLAAPALPPPAPEELALLRQVGAVHMQGYLHPPREARGLKLLVWPELGHGQRPALSEGRGLGRHIRPPFEQPGLHHLLGLELRQAQGPELNALVLARPDGAVLGVRAKRLLFPWTEEPQWGGALRRVRYRRGEAPPLLRPEGGLPPFVPLLCLEAMDHGQSHQGKALGARWIAVAAHESILAGSRWGHREVLGMSVWLAVATGLPVVRASGDGQAAFIASNGQVLALSALGQDGVLRCPASQP